MYGQALLDIPCIKVLMGTDGKNLQETRDLYNLTEAEEELLMAKKRGHALFIVGSKRLHLHFEIPAYKFEYMGKAVAGNEIQQHQSVCKGGCIMLLY